MEPDKIELLISETKNYVFNTVFSEIVNPCLQRHRCQDRERRFFCYEGYELLPRDLHEPPISYIRLQGKKFLGRVESSERDIYRDLILFTVTPDNND